MRKIRRNHVAGPLFIELQHYLIAIIGITRFVVNIPVAVRVDLLLDQAVVIVIYSEQ
jgi:hypothetical protein